MATMTVEPRFIPLTDLTKILNISARQARSLVTSGDIPAIQIGGRGVWRIEKAEVEAYIERQYAAVRARAPRTPGPSSSE